MSHASDESDPVIRAYYSHLRSSGELRKGEDMTKTPNHVCGDINTSAEVASPPSRWRALARNNQNAATILQASGATDEVIATFTAAAREANGVAAALDELAKTKEST
jgi:hypothetical protein